MHNRFLQLTRTTPCVHGRTFSNDGLITKAFCLNHAWCVMILCFCGSLCVGAFYHRFVNAIHYIWDGMISLTCAHFRGGELKFTISLEINAKEAPLTIETFVHFSEGQGTCCGPHQSNNWTCSGKKLSSHILYCCNSLHWLDQHETLPHNNYSGWHTYMWPSPTWGPHICTMHDDTHICGPHQREGHIYALCIWSIMARMYHGNWMRSFLK